MQSDLRLRTVGRIVSKRGHDVNKVERNVRKGRKEGRKERESNKMREGTKRRGREVSAETKKMSPLVSIAPVVVGK